MSDTPGTTDTDDDDDDDDADSASSADTHELGMSDTDDEWSSSGEETLRLMREHVPIDLDFSGRKVLSAPQSSFHVCRCLDVLEATGPQGTIHWGTVPTSSTHRNVWAYYATTT